MTSPARAKTRANRGGLVVLGAVLGGTAVACGSLSFALSESNRAAGVQAFPYASANALVAIAAGLMGALIATLRPRLSLGWLMLTAAVLSAIDALAGEYGPYAYESASAALAFSGVWLSWLANWTWVVAGFFVTLLLLVFPTGRLPSSRWRIAVWAIAGGTALLALTFALPSNTLYWTSISNPVGISWAAPLLDALHAVEILNLILTTVVIALSIGVRFWRARGLERQQLKWFLYGVTIWSAVWAGATIVDIVRESSALRSSPVVAVSGLTLVLGSIGIGILRYRLFDIDVIINRTLVYSLVTAMLAGAFAGLSTLTQHIALVLTGEESQAAVVIAALIVTALIQPLSSAVQRIVDRRFYRARYDASRMLEQFSRRVRNEVELDRLTDSLITVVQESMQPTYVSLWLRPRQNPTERHPAESD
jgi:hypothetical protein